MLTPHIFSTFSAGPRPYLNPCLKKPPEKIFRRSVGLSTRRNGLGARDRSPETATAPFVRSGRFRPGLKALLMLPLLFSSSGLLASAHDGVSAAASPLANAPSAQGLGESLAQGIQNTPAASAFHATGADAASGLAFSWGSYIQAMGMLFLALGLLWFAVWLLKRYGVGKIKALTGRGKNLELLETISLGPKRAAVLLRAKDRVFLLGITEQRINMLSEIYDETDAEAHDFPPDKTQG